MGDKLLLNLPGEISALNYDFILYTQSLYGYQPSSWKSHAVHVEIKMCFTSHVKLHMPTFGAKLINTMNMSKPTTVNIVCHSRYQKEIKWYIVVHQRENITFWSYPSQKKKYAERKELKLISNYSLSIRSSVKALARSSGVGRSKTQPFLRAPWAADCTVFRTPLLLANVTTCCLSDWRSLLPTPRPKSSASTFPVMAAWSCRWK